jgi:hypothetical protein
MLTERRIQLADEKVVRSYVEDLRQVLANSPLPEQKAFIRSFVKEVRVTGKEVLLTYTIPLPPEGSLQETATVLDTVHYGGPIITFPHQKVETFFEIAVAHTPQGGRSELWARARPER